MPERFATTISIGGRLPRALATKLAKVIRSEVVSLDVPVERGQDRFFDNPIFSPILTEDLLSVLKNTHLTLVDVGCAWGQFKDLEGFLVKNHIAFTRHTAGTDEYLPEVIHFRRGMRKPMEFLATDSGEIIISASSLSSTFKKLQKACNTNTPVLARDLVQSALHHLHHLAGTAIPVLPPFTIV